MTVREISAAQTALIEPHPAQGSGNLGGSLIFIGREVQPHQ
jgi:hypothetical protein